MTGGPEGAATVKESALRNVRETIELPIRAKKAAMRQSQGRIGGPFG